MGVGVRKGSTVAVVFNFTVNCHVNQILGHEHKNVVESTVELRD